MPPESSYDSDVYLWSQEQAAALRDGKVDALDLAHLAEEIDSVGVSQEHALGSHLQVLLLHLLKWQYEPTHRQDSHSWEDTIEEARDRISDLLQRSPSLTRLLAPLLQKHYPRAVRTASRHTGLPRHTFPAACPWDLECQVLHEEFFPAG
jgi:hypothetical protein